MEVQALPAAFNRKEPPMGGSYETKLLNGIRMHESGGEVHLHEFLQCRKSFGDSE